MVSWMQNLDAKYYTNLFQMLQKPEVINLAVGQPDFKPPSYILNVIKENIEEYTGYTDIKGLPELRDLIKRKLRKENKVNAEEVIVTNGAVEALFDSMLAYLDRNSEVILFSPHYGKYLTAPRLIGARVKTVSLEDKRPNIEKLESKITRKTKLVVVNSPCNPTGTVHSREEIKQLVEIVERHNLILLSDEIYEKYVYDDGRKHVSLGKYSDRVITVNSFSKTYGFPGLRLGYLAGTAELVAPILDVHMSNTTCSPYASQKAAAVALRGGYNFFDIASFDKRRKLVMKKLDEIGIEYIYPEGAFYVYIYINRNSLELADELLHKKLLVMPSQLFGDGNDAIRISYATDKETLENGLELLIKNLYPRKFNS